MDWLFSVNFFHLHVCKSQLFYCFYVLTTLGCNVNQFRLPINVLHTNALANTMLQVFLWLFFLMQFLKPPEGCFPETPACDLFSLTCNLFSSA